MTATARLALAALVALAASCGSDQPAPALDAVALRLELDELIRRDPDQKIAVRERIITRFGVAALPALRAERERIAMALPELRRLAAEAETFDVVAAQRLRRELDASANTLAQLDVAIRVLDRRADD
ncbi:MAG: hypothetical protein IPM29_22435 [Planctomycetes bacterium]|nr:hypothetical protein [Planctomycetota bacterium]